LRRKIFCFIYIESYFACFYRRRFSSLSLRRRRTLRDLLRYPADILAWNLSLVTFGDTHERSACAREIRCKARVSPYLSVTREIRCKREMRFSRGGLSASACTEYLAFGERRVSRRFSSLSPCTESLLSPNLSCHREIR